MSGRIKSPDAVSVRPTPASTGTQGYFSDLNSTVVTDDWLNDVQEMFEYLFDHCGATITRALGATGDPNLYDSINAMVNASVIPTGSRVVFAQAVAPTGWTKITTFDNHMLRVVSDSSGGQSGGVNSPIIMNVIPSHTHGINVTSGTESALHSHSFSANTSFESNPHNHPATNNRRLSTDQGIGGWQAGTSGFWNTADDGSNVQSHFHSVSGQTGTESAGHSHNVNGTTDTNAGAASWQPKYLNTIVCAKS